LTGVANIVNNSTSFAGVLVSGVSQFIGNIDGNGITQVIQGSLTAQHIVQAALDIIGSSVENAVVTIVGDILDVIGLADGAALSPGLMPFNSNIAPSGPIAGLALREGSMAGDWGLGTGSDALTGSGVDDPILLGMATDSSTFNSGAAVPEPAAMILASCGIAVLLTTEIQRRLHRR
jgi:hypothetical protein